MKLQLLVLIFYDIITLKKEKNKKLLLYKYNYGAVRLLLGRPNNSGALCAAREQTVFLTAAKMFLKG